MEIFPIQEGFSDSQIDFQAEFSDLDQSSLFGIGAQVVAHQSRGVGQKRFLIQRPLYREVGIRPGGQCADCFLPGAKGRERKDGRLLQLPEPSDNGHTVSIGDSEIQDDQDKVEAGVQTDCLGICFRMVDLQGGGLQTVCDLLAERLIPCNGQRLAFAHIS